MSIIEQVRSTVPLIHHLTNQVVMNFTANGLLAFGGSPIMAKELEEVHEMASLADAVLINIGTLTQNDLEAMLLAGKTANERNIPVVLDPVGVSATSFRKRAVEKLLDYIRFSAIKGNAGEMAHLAGLKWRTKGVESAEGSIKEVELIAQKVATTYKTLAIVTGRIDVISDGQNIKSNESGHPILTKITGAGCLLGSVIAASLAVSVKPLEDCHEALHFYGKAAERAIEGKGVKGTGTFKSHFIDELQR